MSERNTHFSKPHFVILIEQRLTQRNFQRFGIEKLIERGIAVSYLDVSKVFGRVEAEAPFAYPQPLLHFSHHVFQDLREVLIFLNGLEQEAYIFLGVGLNTKSLSLFRCLSAHKFKMGELIFATPALPKPLWRRAWNVLTMPSKLGYQFFNRIPLKFLNIRKIDFAIATGNIALKTAKNKLTTHGTLIDAHSMDYEFVLKESTLSPPVLLPSSYALFIDQDLPYHPDIISAKYPTVEAYRYYQSLADFFDIVERDLGIPVVIAAHPRCADLELAKARYRGRAIYRGQTPALIQSSRLVLNHFSTSVGLAVAFKKPIVFLTTPETEAVERFRHFIQASATALKSSPLNTANTFSVDNSLFTVPEVEYESYLNNYMKVPGSAEKPLWDIFADWVILDHSGGASVV